MSKSPSFPWRFSSPSTPGLFFFILLLPNLSYAYIEAVLAIESRIV